MSKIPIDFHVSDQGSVHIFLPLTPSALAEVDKMGIEDWQRIGGGFAVDHRPAADLVVALEDNGFIVSY